MAWFRPATLFPLFPLFFRPFHDYKLSNSANEFGLVRRLWIRDLQNGYPIRPAIYQQRGEAERGLK